MKTLSLLLALPLSAFAHYGKPQILASYAGMTNWNAPPSVYCFYSEPAVFAGAVYLGCLEGENYIMAKWDESGYSEVARAEIDQRFSYPVSFNEGVSWYEYNEFSSVRSFTTDGREVKIKDLQKLGPVGTFLPLGDESWLYQLKTSTPEVWILNAEATRPVFTQNVSYIFSPVVGGNGEAIMKVRKESLSNSAPDELWSLVKGKWQKILEDKDANPSSNWKSFRHQYAVEGERVLLFAHDNQSEVLVLFEGDKSIEIARAGIHLDSFDHFSAKMNAGVIAFRGKDLQGRKAVWTYKNGKLSRLITQGDTVMTIKGPAQVHYKNEHSIFYGAPGIGPKGEVVIQATLSDPDYLDTLIGVAVLKFEQE